MKILGFLGSLLLIACVAAALAVAVVVQLLIQMLPYLLLAALVVGAVKLARRRWAAPAPVLVILLASPPAAPLPALPAPRRNHADTVIFGPAAASGDPAAPDTTGRWP